MTNWPDPTRPGVPLNPEKDGWHWLYRDGEGSDCALWLARSRCWQLVGTEEFFEAYEMVVRRWRYLGPVLTFDEASALQKRVVELEGALDFYACVDHYQMHNAVAPNVVQFDRGAKARAALAGGKDE